MSKPKTSVAKPAGEEVVTAQEPTQVTDEAVQDSDQELVTEASVQEPAEPTEVTQEAKEDATQESGQEQGAEPAEGSEQKEVPELVTVQSLAKSSLRQPSSGWVIEPGKARNMLVDGWLENQLNAKLLQKV